MSWESDNRRRTGLRRRRRMQQWRLRLITGGVILGIVALIALSISLVRDHQTALATAQADTMEETETQQTTEQVTETDAQETTESDTQEDVAEPYVVVVDAGHGGKDQGCAYEGAIEKDIILPIALYLQEELENMGVTVVMTRDDDTFLYLNRRVEAAEKADADAYISIHIDSFESDESVYGMTIHHQDGARGGKVLATLLHDMLVEEDFERVRDVHASNLYVLRNTTMPAVLVEAGFVTNPDDRAKMQTEEYQKTLANVLAEGVVRYLDETSIEKGEDDSPGDDMVIDEE